MSKTNIEWVVNPDGSRPGYTWNPITGCLNHIDGMCKGGGFPCYAFKLANGRLKPLYRANDNLAPVPRDLRNYSLDPFYPRFWENRLYELVNKIRRWGKQSQVVHTQGAKGIFVCDMSDLFGIGIPEEWTRKVLDRFQYCPQHRFYLLTKQPQNLINFSPFPDNCEVGITVTNDEAYTFATYYLEKVEAKVKCLSLEPLLSVIDCGKPWDKRLKLASINRAIIGACTGTKTEMFELKRKYPDLTVMPFGNKWTAQPKIEWVKEIVEAADRAGIPVFMKDNLMPLIPPFGNELFPPAIRVRQEMPDGNAVV